VVIGEGMITEVTNEVLDAVKAWQSRPLDELYPILYLDAQDGSILRTRNNWQMTDVADFDGDGDADLLFRLPELNQTAIIRLDGQQLVDYQFINSAPTLTATVKGVSAATIGRPATIYWQTPDNQQVFVQSVSFANEVLLELPWSKAICSVVL
jgi:hypothetical protein